jgi:dihydroxyacetone kinase-like protein
VRGKIKKADELTAEILAKILADNPIKQGDEVALLVNGLGGTPLMELFVINRAAHEILKGNGAKVLWTNVGNYMTAIEMAGFSLSVLKLDAELKKFLDAKADTPAFKVV